MSIEAPPSTTPSPSPYWAPNALFTIGLEKWKQQQADVALLDSKTSGLFTASSTVLIAILAVLKLHEPVPIPSRILTLAALVAFVFSTFCLGKAAFIRNYAMGPATNQTKELADSHNDDEMKHWAGRGFLNAIDENRPLLNSKADNLTRAFLASMVEIVFLASAVAWSYFQ